MLTWEEEWFFGSNSSADAGLSLSSFSIIDEMMATMMDIDLYPNLTSIILIGHSKGGVAAQRFALSSSLEPRQGVTLNYYVVNPSSVAYLTAVRPVLISRDTRCDNNTVLMHNWSFAVPQYDDACGAIANYDEYPKGLGMRQNPPPYVAARKVDEMRRAFLKRNVTYVAGTADVCPCITSFDGTNCSGHAVPTCSTQGMCHLETLLAFAQHVQQVQIEIASADTCDACVDRALSSHRLVKVPRTGHNHCAMFQADETLASMFPFP